MKDLATDQLLREKKRIHENSIAAVKRIRKQNKIYTIREIEKQLEGKNLIQEVFRACTTVLKRQSLGKILNAF